MYLDTFLGSIGVDAGAVAKIRSTLDAFADDIGGVKLPQAGGFGGSAAGHRMTTETNAAQEFMVSAMQDLADSLREFGINLELWQDDMAYTDDDAAVQIQAIQKVQETVTEAVRAPTTIPASAGGA